MIKVWCRLKNLRERNIRSQKITTVRDAGEKVIMEREKGQMRKR